MHLVLATSRLTVRQFLPSDTAGLHDVCRDPRVMRSIGTGVTLTLDECRMWIDESSRHFAHGGHGAAAVFVAGRPAMAGFCGIVPARRRQDRELLFAFRPEHWRQGFATELVPALVRHGFEVLKLPRLVALCQPDNHASRRALERAGLQCAGEELAAEGVTMLIYLIER
jgi:RimJ/RimL family protein N-acetyltransferase